LQWWTEKHRYLVNGQQLFRIDKDMHHFAGEVPDLTSIDAVVLSDYGKSWLGYVYCRALISEAKKRHIPVVVDPKKDGWAKFSGCTVICPNEVEAKNPEIGAFDVVLFKKGAQGLLLKDHTWETKFPAVARQVYDVTGAGDTVVATVAAVLACGGNLHEAARLANIAAGAVVGKRGTATVTNDELLDLVGNQ
jgi:D-beta-D-heptose 7-phosphate kinase/D-beta-D-heptose 1-phosphate adenosyltransferase